MLRAGRRRHADSVLAGQHVAEEIIRIREGVVVAGEIKVASTSSSTVGDPHRMGIGLPGLRRCGGSGSNRRSIRKTFRSASAREPLRHRGRPVLAEPGDHEIYAPTQLEKHRKEIGRLRAADEERADGNASP